MSIIRRLLTAVSLAVWLAAPGAHAAGLQISQVADRPPELMVFLSAGEFTPGPRAAAASAASAALSASGASAAAARPPAAPASSGAPAASAAPASATRGALQPASASAAAVAGGPTVTAALGATPLPVKSFTAWDKADGVALVLAIDVSASLGEQNFNTIKQQVRAMLAQLPARSKVALLSIGSDVKTVQGFGPAATAGAALDRLTADAPETALYEAVMAAQQMAARAPADLPLRRAVLVLTDGIDDSSRGVGREEALQRIARGDAPVYALALGSRGASSTSSSQREAVKALAQIARTSGGDLMQAAPGKAADGLAALSKQLLQANLLTLDCTPCARDGAPHTLEVVVQQREGSISASRDIRLSVLPPVVPSAPASGPASSPVSSPACGRAAGASAAGCGGKTSIVSGMDDWMLFTAAATVTLLLLGLGLWLWRRRHPDAQPYVMPDAPADDDEDWPSRKQPTPTPDLDKTGGAWVPAPTPAPEATPPRGVPVTLDVAGRGQVKVQVGKDVVLGRSRQADVSVEADTEASSRHAALYAERGAVMLRDLDSSNGTYLNGTRIVRPEPLSDGDVILVGRSEIRVYLGRS